MPITDVANQFKSAIGRLVERELTRDAKQRAIDLGTQFSGKNPLGATVTTTESMAMFATGYNTGTGETTMGFTFGLSEFGGDDVLG